MSLLVIGTVAFDAIETPFGKTDKILGGAATFISLAASQFAEKVNIVSVIGGDMPDENLKMLNNHGVNTDGIEIIQDGKTFFWSGKYHLDMNTRDTLETQLNVLETFDPKVPDSYQDCEYLMLGNLAPAVQKKVIESLNTRPKLIVLDTMNFWMDIAMDELKEVLTMIDVLSINDEEARQLSGEYSLVKAARKIREMGPKYLVIKKGEHGALLFGDEEVFFAPALPLEEVFDPTGAGDSFAGGFIGYLAQMHEHSFEDMKRAVIYGSAAASFTVEKFGTEKLQNLSHDEFQKRVQEFVSLVNFNL